MSARELPIADAPFLSTPARRARLLRWTLTAALAALVGTAVAIAPHGGGRQATPVTASGETTEIVLDVSGSVGDGSYRAVGEALAALSRGRRPVGLILFSDSAEEALPPGTPPVQLVPFARIFTPKGPRPAAWNQARGDFEPSPWYPSFSGGTRISVGLAAAAAAIRRDHARARVVVISDLGDAPDDRGHLRRELLALGKAGLDVQVLPLPTAHRQDRRWFERLEGKQAVLDRLSIPPPVRRPTRASWGVPIGLAAIGVLLAIALALDELAGRSLRWGIAR